MGKWKIEWRDEFIRCFERYKKKQPEALEAVFANLDKYMKALNDGAIPQNVRGNYIHPEKKGVVALDEQGPFPDLPKTRLYIFLSNHIVYLLRIGDETSQQDDIRRCHEIAKAITRENK